LGGIRNAAAIAFGNFISIIFAMFASFETHWFKVTQCYYCKGCEYNANMQETMDNRQ
jgi:hypothetical protein